MSTHVAYRLVVTELRLRLAVTKAAHERTVVRLLPIQLLCLNLVLDKLQDLWIVLEAECLTGEHGGRAFPRLHLLLLID